MQRESTHILVVDDDAGIRGTVQAILEDEGYTVSSAVNGVEALESIRQDRPTLVLLDLQMPVMNGWEVLQRLREGQTGIPVVFMTAGFRAQTEAERYSADGHLAKPFDLDDLLNVVERFSESEQRSSS